MNRKIVKRLVACAMAVCTICSFSLSNTIIAFAQEDKVIISNTNQDPNESGYVFGSVAINGGGYVPSIIFNKSERNIAYMRTDMGGAYRWNAEYERWVPLTDWISAADWNLLGCESIATDPIETNRVYIAAGTYTNDWTNQNGHILRSTDYGETFERIELPFKCGGNMPGRNMGERLMVDPNDNSVLYLGARSGNGLWKSTDYGSTWSKVESFTETGSYIAENDPIGVVWVQFDSSSSEKGQACQTMYVGVANEGKENTIFYTNDGGETWAPVEGQPTYNWTATSDIPGNYLPHRSALASDGNLYITYCNQEGPYNGNKGGVWKYDTKNKVWTDITPADVNSSYWGYGGITVDATNPNIIMASVLNCYYPDNNIYRSIDGGKTWTPFWSYDASGSKSDKFTINYSDVPWLDWSKDAEAPVTSPKLGWMVGDIKIDPFDSNHVVYGTGATLYSSNNITNLEEGKKINIKTQIAGVEETAVLDLVSLPSGNTRLMSGLADIGGFAHTNINKSPKMPINPAISNCTSIDYAELNPDKIVRVGDLGVVGLSIDGGEKWFEPSGDLNIPSGEGGHYMETGGSVAMGADGNIMVYSPNIDGTSVCYTEDDGENWTKSAGIPAKAKVASDRVNPNKFYGILDGNFYVSTDGGKNFEKTATGLPVGTIDMSAMPGVEGDIWFAGQGIWHSTDSGKTFEKLSNVDDASIIGFGKAASGTDYMSLYTNATIDDVTGIYRSDDKGISWIRVNDDNHQYGAANTSITGDKRVYGRFYLGTNGRGIVVGELAD